MQWPKKAVIIDIDVIVPALFKFGAIQSEKAMKAIREMENHGHRVLIRVRDNNFDSLNKIPGGVDTDKIVVGEDMSIFKADLFIVKKFKKVPKGIRVARYGSPNFRTWGVWPNVVHFID